MATPNPSNEQENAVMLISYKTLRTIVGVLGMFLAAILVTGMWILSDKDPFQSSISHFYHTRMGDVFVGLLSAISIFLFVYKGPERPDHWLGNIAGVLGLIVAFVPTIYHGAAANEPGCMYNRARYNPAFTQYIHLGAAFLFLCILAAFSLWLFPKTHPGQKVQRGTKKWKRNIWYYVCGIVMALCLISLLLVFALKTTEEIQNSEIVFWLEATALFFFGISWLVKGEQVMLRD